MTNPIFPGLPAVPAGPPPLVNFLRVLKENIELLTGNGAGGQRPYQLLQRSVSNLPGNSPGLVMYATDGRKAGEGVGKGSGVMIFSDTTQWCACDTGLAVQR